MNHRDHEEINEVDLYDYDAHSAFISRIMQQSDNYEKVREALNRFKSVLLPKVEDWYNWLNDCKEFGITDDLGLKELFDEALKDHPGSVKLWLEYLKYISDRPAQYEGIILTEFKKASAFPAWDMKAGNLIFEEQVRRFPNQQTTFMPHSFKDQFTELEGSFPENFRKYLQTVRESKFLSSSDKLSLSRVLYERVLDHEGDDFGVWQEYLTFLRHEMKVSSVILGVNYRLTRAHPLNPLAWTSLFESLELFGKPSTDILEEMNGAFKRIPFAPSRETFLLVRLAKLNYLRRSNSTSKLLEFQNALQEEEMSFGPDPQGRLARYFAQIAALEGDIERMRQIWQHLLKIHAKEAAFWLEYLQLERALLYGKGDSDNNEMTDRTHHASLHQQLQVISNGFKRAVAGVTDYPETVFYEWIQFEGQFGSLESLLEARDRVDKQRILLKERAEAAMKKNSKTSNFENAYSTTDATAVSRTSNSLKRSRLESSTSAKSSTDKVIPSFNPLATLFVNNLPFDWSEEDIHDHFRNLLSRLQQSTQQDQPAVKSIRMHRNTNNNSFKGHATIEFDCEETAQQVLKQFNKEPTTSGGTRPIFLAQYTSPLKNNKNIEGEGSSDAKTLYISNIQSDDELMKELIPLLQGIQQIRHIPGKKFAYIEFESEKGAKEALLMIENSPINLKAAFSKPPLTKQRSTDQTTPSTITSSKVTSLMPRSLSVKIPPPKK